MKRLVLYLSLAAALGQSLVNGTTAPQAFIETPEGQVGIRHISHEVLLQRVCQLNPALLTDHPLTEPGNQIAWNLFRDCELTITTTHCESPSPSCLTLRGSVAGHEDATAVFAVQNEVVSGLVKIPDLGNFEISFLEDGHYKISQLNPEADPGCALEAVSSGQGPVNLPANPGEKLPHAQQGSSTTTITVLVLYTPAALKFAGSKDAIEARIQAAFEEVRWAMERSGITVKLLVVHQTQIDYRESGHAANDNRNLRNHAQAASLRTKYRADLVLMITGHATNNGYAEIPERIDDTHRKGFASVVLSRLSVNYFLAHELGHNLGCLHARDSGLQLLDPLLTSNYGHRFEVGDKLYRTIMASDPGRKIVHFSNPKVLFQGVPTGMPTGHAEQADCASTISFWAPHIANNEQADTFFSFETDKLSVDEDSGSLNVKVIRSGDLSVLSRFTVSTLDRSAKSGSDFVSLRFRSQFLPGETENTVPLEITDDAFLEGDENLLLNISGLSVNQSLRFNGTLEVTVRDDESGFRFAEQEIIINENQESATVVVERFGDVEQAASVMIQSQSETAMEGEDVHALQEVLAFEPMVSRMEISVALLNDDHAEAVETFTLKLSSPSDGSGLVSENTMRIQIRDEEGPGALDGSFNAGTGPNGTVRTFTSLPDNGFLIGGQFTRVDGREMPYVARYSASGELDSTFSLGMLEEIQPMEYSHGAAAFLKLPDGDILVVGDFNTNTDPYRSNLICVDPQGIQSDQFTMGSGPDGPVNALGFQGDKLIVGGRFKHFNGHPVISMVRLNPDGSLDTSFDAGLTWAAGLSNGGIRDLTVLPDGKVLIVGSFREIHGQPVSRMARLLRDGQLDESFTQVGLDHNVQALEVQPDGKIVLGGRFGLPGDFIFKGIVRLNPNGTVDSSFRPGRGTNARVNCLKILPDGKILIGGAFTEVNGIPRKYVALLNEDGSLNESFDPAYGPGDYIWGLVQQNNGWVVLGGEFSTIQDKNRFHLARIRNEVKPMMTPGRINGTEFETTLMGLPGSTYRVESSSNFRDWEEEMILESVRAEENFTLQIDPDEKHMFFRIISK